MKIIVVLLLSVVAFNPGLSIAQTDLGLRVGEKAPDFSLRFATMDSIASVPLQLSTVIGKRSIVLAFYPADWSGGCTKEVCSLRDNFTDLSGLNAEILAISGDYVFSHHEWAKYHHLPFKLLSDHAHEVAKAYFSYNEQNGYNKRTVFIIDTAGMITYIDLHYSVNDAKSFEQLKKALEDLR